MGVWVVTCVLQHPRQADYATMRASMGCYDAALCGTFAVSGVRRCNRCRGYDMLLVVYEYILVFSVYGRTHIIVLCVT